MTTQTQAPQMVAKRVAPNFPAWDLFADGFNIGVMTDFEGEGPVATVRTQTKGDERVEGDDINECLVYARAAFELGHATYDPYYMTEEEARREAEAEAKWEVLRSEFDFDGNSVVEAHEFINGLKRMALKLPLDAQCFAQVQSAIAEGLAHQAMADWLANGLVGGAESRRRELRHVPLADGLGLALHAELMVLHVVEV